MPFCGARILLWHTCVSSTTGRYAGSRCSGGYFKSISLRLRTVRLGNSLRLSRLGAGSSMMYQAVEILIFIGDSTPIRNPMIRPDSMIRGG